MEKTSRKRITIIGTGLIGGSIGLALKASGVAAIEIAGHDRDRGNELKAEKMGAIDHAEHNLPRAVSSASMVVIATPVRAIREVMGQIAPDLAEGAIVTDTGSTKARVMQWGRELLPPHVSFIGGHPMAGKETQGIENAEAGLFRGRAYCICPAVEAQESAVKSVMGLANLIGAEPLFIDPEEHDQYAAAVSHLPLLVSTALFSLLQTSRAWPDLAPMASTGFHDITRLASGDPALSHAIWTTNREALIHWLERMTGELQRFRDLLADAQDESLLEIFARAKLERDAFVLAPPVRARPADTREAPKQMLVDMLVGGMMANTLRKMQKLPELAAQAPRETGEPRKKQTLGGRMAEGIRRDLEKLEEKRAAKEEHRDKSD